MKNKKKKMGFTLIELVVVLVIIGILSIIAVPMYRGYVGRAMASEGRALLGAVAGSEKIYFAEYGVFLLVNLTGHDPELDVDSTMNTYFRSYSVALTNTSLGFEATTSGVTGGGAEGITVTFDQYPNSAPVVEVTGV
ncbi:MAG: prepilin-type N-terminal cleavage/methylation domain-containing protein [Elusimicrobiota bacterium]